ncbi:MAG: hypothetical protein RR983_10280, partial [Massilia sp.]
FEPGYPLFAQLSRDSGVGRQLIFLTQHSGDCAVGGAVYFVVPDARATLAAIDGARAVQAARDAHEFGRAGRAALALRKRCDKLRLQARWASEDLAKSSDDAKAVARIKARRMADTLAVECPG